MVLLVELPVPISPTKSLSWPKSKKPDISSKLVPAELEVKLVEVGRVEVGETGVREAA